MQDIYDHPASALALAVFRLNGALIAAGDALVQPLGLTSARWQVMGAIMRTEDGLPAAQIARDMGLARQSVQRLLDEMGAAGLVAFAPNPRHKRAKLARLTAHGRDLFLAASARWRPLADALVAGLAEAELGAVVRLLHQFHHRLEGETP